MYVKAVASGSVSDGTPITDLVLTLAGGVSVPAGHTILLAAGGGAVSSRTVSTIVDSQGNTWELSRNDGSGSFPLCIAKCSLTTDLNAGDTITITWSGTMGTVIAVAHEFSNLGSAAVDQTASANGSTTAPSSGTTGATAVADELVFGAVLAVWVTVEPSDDFTPGAGYTELPAVLTTGGSSVHRALHTEYRLVSATGTYAADGTFATAHNWRASVATYATGTDDTERTGRLWLLTGLTR
jgi:hypothetical protein